MSTIETEAKAGAPSDAAARPAVKVKPKKSESIIDKVLSLFSSVRLGVTMLMILLTCCILGMLVMQQDVDGFHTYFERLTPAQKLIYTRLDLFNIYHSWYFSLLLALIGLNIILASIDRFPTAWEYVRNPKLKASPNFIRAQMFNTEVEVSSRAKDFAQAVMKGWKKKGFRTRINEEQGRTTVFGQRNAWNRLGAYFVHVALLTIGTSFFITIRYGVGGMMEIVPGKTSDTFQTLKVELDGNRVGLAKLPFSIECTDLQQQLVRPEGGLDASNTVDWLSYVIIKDKEQNRDVPALVHLNEPFDYAGYRLFQSKFVARGNARQLTVALVPVTGGQPREVTIRRNESADVDGVGRMSYVDFFPDFKFGDDGRPETETGDYNNPAALIMIVGPDGKKRGTLAFNKAFADEFYSKNKQEDTTPLLVDGNKVILESFEKVASSHTLAVQYDPGRKPVYIGFIMVVLALSSVFFFSHQRLWAVIEPQGDKAKVYFGGNTNRNRPAFEGRFNSLVELVIPKRGTDHEQSH